MEAGKRSNSVNVGTFKASAEYWQEVCQAAGVHQNEKECIKRMWDRYSMKVLEPMRIRNGGCYQVRVPWRTAQTPGDYAHSCWFNCPRQLGAKQIRARWSHRWKCCFRSCFSTFWAGSTKRTHSRAFSRKSGIKVQSEFPKRTVVKWRRSQIHPASVASLSQVSQEAHQALEIQRSSHHRIDDARWTSPILKMRFSKHRLEKKFQLSEIVMRSV